MRYFLAAALFLCSAASAQTPCGALATGKRIDGRVTTEQAPGWHVDRDGGWTTCAMPQEPAGCIVPRGYSWVANGSACRTPNGGQSLPHGGLSPALQAVGPTTGLIVLQCTNGVLSPRLATCSPLRFCEGTHVLSDTGGGTTWRWSGTLPIGGRDVAVNDDSDTRPVECLSSGTLRLL